MGTNMHYALASLEDNVISALESAFDELDSANVNTLMFDGLIVRIASDDRQRLQDILAQIEHKFTVTFEVTFF